MIHKFISGLSATEKKVFLLAALAVTAALFDRLLISPATGRLRQLNEAIEKEQNVVRQNQHFLAYRERIMKDASVFGDYFTQEVKAEEEVIADFLKQVELMATKANVQMSKLTPAGQEYTDDFLKYLVSLDCSASLTDLTSFIYALQSSKNLFKVEKMTVSSGKAEDVVQATLTISRLVIGADPSVSAKTLVRIKDSLSSDQSKASNVQ